MAPCLIHLNCRGRAGEKVSLEDVRRWWSLLTHAQVPLISHLHLPNCYLKYWGFFPPCIKSFFYSLGKPMLPWYPSALTPDLHWCDCFPARWGSGFVPLLPRTKPTKARSGAEQLWGGVKVGRSAPASLRTCSKRHLLGYMLEEAGSGRAILPSAFCVGANTKKLRIKCWLIMTLTQNLLSKQSLLTFAFLFFCALTGNERNRAFSWFLCKHKSCHPPHAFIDKMTMHTLS